MRGGYEKKHWTIPGPDYFRELFRVSKQQIIWGCNYFLFPFGPGRIVWDKVNPGSSFSDCELAYCSMIETVRKFTFMWNGMLQGKSIAEGHIMQGNKKRNEKRIHPTQKPVALYKWLLSKFAKPGDIILDTHFGSGSHGIACHDLGFELVAVDIDADCTARAAQRIKAHQAQTSLFAAGLAFARIGFVIDLSACMLSIEESKEPTECPSCTHLANLHNSDL